METGLLEALGQGVVLGDGGYVDELMFRGYGTPKVIEVFPDALRLLHQDFFRAGAQVLQAQTGWATRSHLEKRCGPGYGKRMEEFNQSAIRLAKGVAGDDAFVAGCLWPSGSFDPADKRSADRACAEWEEQVAILLEAGVDLLICECFDRLDEARLALRCCKKIATPTMVTVGMEWEEEQTADGVSPRECARILVDDGADIVGSDSAREPEDMLPLVLEMQEAVDVPVAFQPSGFHVSAPGWENQPESMRVACFEMCAYALQARMKGIDYIGGGRGAGPEHIRAIAQPLGYERVPMNQHPRDMKIKTPQQGAG